MNSRDAIIRRQKWFSKELNDIVYEARHDSDPEHPYHYYIKKLGELTAQYLLKLEEELLDCPGPVGP